MPAKWDIAGLWRAGSKLPNKKNWEQYKCAYCDGLTSMPPSNVIGEDTYSPSCCIACVIEDRGHGSEPLATAPPEVLAVMVRRTKEEIAESMRKFLEEQKS